MRGQKLDLQTLYDGVLQEKIRACGRTFAGFIAIENAKAFACIQKKTVRQKL